MRTILPTLLVLVGCLPTWSSEADAPLGGCEDWVIVEPGITCSEVIPYPCLDEMGAPITVCRARTATANATHGGFYATSGYGRFISLGVCRDRLRRTEIVFFDGVSDNVIAYIDDRCDEVNMIEVERRVFSPGLTFEESSGSLFYAFDSFCTCSNCPIGDICPSPSFGSRLLRFDGFPSLTDTDDDGPFTTLCHCPPRLGGQGCHTINVGAAAAGAHFTNHGFDSAGACAEASL